MVFHERKIVQQIMENVLFLCEKQNEFAHKMIDKKMFGK